MKCHGLAALLLEKASRCAPLISGPGGKDDDRARSELAAKVPLFCYRYRLIVELICDYELVVLGRFDSHCLSL